MWLWLDPGEGGAAEEGAASSGRTSLGPPRGNIAGLRCYNKQEVYGVSLRLICAFGTAVYNTEQARHRRATRPCTCTTAR